jgi:hypothetical protein
MIMSALRPAFFPSLSCRLVYQEIVEFLSTLDRSNKPRRFEEIADGIVVNNRAKQRLTYSDHCVERGLRSRTGRKCTRHSIQAVKEILSANLKLN